LTPAVSEAIAAIAALGIDEPSLGRIQERLRATWLALDRRGSDRDSLFQRWWRQLVAEAQAPGIKSPPGWLTAAFTRNDRSDAVLAGVQRPGASEPSKPRGAAYSRFVPPSEEV
jgi:hypothetical protein